MADADHFITREDMRLWFLLKLRDILPHARTDEDRWEFARYALHVEDIKDWPGPLGRRVGTDPSTQEGLEKAVERVRLAAHIAEEAGEFQMVSAKKEEQPVREIDATVDSLVLSNHSEAPAVTFTNIEVNGIPISFTMRQDVTGAASVQVHYEEFQKLIEAEWVETLDVCDKNGNKIRRIKGEPEPTIAPPQPAAQSENAQANSPAPRNAGAPAQNGQKETVATSATVEMIGGQYKSLVFRDAFGNKIANLFFPDPTKPLSRLWDMVIDITNADWPQAQVGATQAINMKLFTIPDPKKPQYNKIIAVGRA